MSRSYFCLWAVVIAIVSECSGNVYLLDGWMAGSKEGRNGEVMMDEWGRWMDRGRKGTATLPASMALFLKVKFIYLLTYLFK